VQQQEGHEQQRRPGEAGPAGQGQGGEEDGEGEEELGEDEEDAGDGQRFAREGRLPEERPVEDDGARGGAGGGTGTFITCRKASV
jgi:hypothetical protein